MSHRNERGRASSHDGLPGITPTKDHPLSGCVRGALIAAGVALGSGDREQALVGRDACSACGTSQTAHSLTTSVASTSEGDSGTGHPTGGRARTPLWVSGEPAGTSMPVGRDVAHTATWTPMRARPDRPPRLDQRRAPERIRAHRPAVESGDDGRSGGHTRLSGVAVWLVAQWRNKRRMMDDGSPASSTSDPVGECRWRLQHGRRPCGSLTADPDAHRGRMVIPDRRP